MNNKISLPPITDILNNKVLGDVYNHREPFEKLGAFDYKYLTNPIKPHNSSHIRFPSTSSLSSYISEPNIHGNLRSSPVSNIRTSNVVVSPHVTYPPVINSNVTELNKNSSEGKIQLPDNITANKVSSNDKRKTRSNLPKGTTYILLNWLNDHINHPYPNNFEKNQLMVLTGLNQQQLSNWFINARRRKIKTLQQNS